MGICAWMLERGGQRGVSSPPAIHLGGTGGLKSPVSNTMANFSNCDMIQHRST